MSEIKSVQCANFTATLGETFRFSLVRESGNVGGMIQTGKVQRIIGPHVVWRLTCICPI